MKAQGSVVLTILLLLTACYSGQRSRMLALLDEADSAIVASDYRAADSLLALFDAEAATAAPARPVAMRRQLLALTCRYVDDALTDADFSMADSLSRYYRHHGNERQLVLSLLAVGDVYKYGGDYPNAVYNLKEALSLADKLDDQLLVGWTCQGLGDIYFNQLMLDDCITYYRRFYTAAQSRHDTLRMAYAAFRMGRTCIINNQIDSIIYYFQKAIDLSDNKPFEDKVVPATRYTLCDIFIQTEQFDKALAIMPHDSLNTQNWAYWHLGMNNLDSAVYYFQRLLGRYSAYEDVDYLHELIKLETSLKHYEKSAYYFSMLEDVEKEKAKLSQTDEIRRANAQFNNSLLTKERDNALKKNSQLKLYLLLTALGMIFIILYLRFININLKQRIQLQEAQKRLIEEELQKAHNRSTERAVEIKNRLSQIHQLTATGSLSESSLYTAEKARLEAELLNLEITLRQKGDVLKEFKSSDVYKRIIESSTDSIGHLRENDWEELSLWLNRSYDNYIDRLQSIAKLSQLELQVCALVKLGVEPSKMASILCKSRAGISAIRRRLYKKITQNNGSPEEMDELLRKF